MKLKEVVKVTFVATITCLGTVLAFACLMDGLSLLFG